MKKEEEKTLASEEITGRYLLSTGEIIKIQKEGNTLYGQFKNGKKSRLNKGEKVNSYTLEEKGKGLSFQKEKEDEIICSYNFRGITLGRKMPKLSLGLAELSAYTGNYYSEELDSTYRIRPGRGKLEVSFRRHPDNYLIPWGDDHFVFEKALIPGGEIKFQKEEGQVTGFKLSGGRIQNLAFQKI